MIGVVVNLCMALLWIALMVSTGSAVFLPALVISLIAAMFCAAIAS